MKTIELLISVFAVAVIVSNGFCRDVLYVSTLVSPQNSRIERFDTLGTPLGGFSLGEWAPTIAVDKAGNIYATAGASKDIRKFAPDGTSLGIFATVGTDQSVAIGLAFDQVGRLYAGVNYCCESGFDTIERIAADGTPLGVFATISTGPPGATFELVFDANGRLYAPDGELVERFDLDGTSMGTFASISRSTFIIDLAFDSHSNLYVMSFADEIYKFDPSGAPLGIILTGSDLSRMTIKDDVLYIGVSNTIRKFLTDGSPLGLFVANLPGTAVDLEFVNIVPEPTGFATFALGVFAFSARFRPHFANRQAPGSHADKR